MRKPFWLIDGKLREAHFFLERLRTTTSLDEARYFFSAFVSAARSVTYAIQVCLKGLVAADDWWESRRRRLKDDPIARYFHDVRNTTVHTGLNPLQAYLRGMAPTPEFLLAGEDIPDPEAVRASTQYMTLLVSIAQEAYMKYWSHLDLPASLTVAELGATGVSFEDIEEELGVPRGWSAGLEPEGRLTLLKAHTQTVISQLARYYKVKVLSESF